MSNLLFECLSEEMPAKMQRHAVSYTKKTIAQVLHKHEISHDDLQVFTTPRRLVIHITEITCNHNRDAIEVIGPRVNSPDIAINGFLQKYSKEKADLQIKTTPKGEFYFFHQEPAELPPLSNILQGILEDFLQGFEWPKAMRWSNKKVKWIRPIVSLLCLLDDEVLPVEFAGLKASCNTQGHRFKSGNLKIIDIPDYFTKLQEGYVMLDQQARLTSIVEQFQKRASDNSLNLQIDEKLCQEIAGLVEYPTILLGKIDQDFMSLPVELLIIVMKNHQRYHHLLDDNMDIAPFFIFVSNNGRDEKVIRGNEKVLRARLADAKFLIDHDLQFNLESYSKKLSNVVFHSNLGSIADKVQRITILAKFIAMWVPNASIMDVERAACLIKADLATTTVKEFPELQGVIGSYYAHADGEKSEIANAIKEHYYPLNNEEESSQNPIAVTLALADRLGSIVGMIAVGEKPSSSRDPFALRRAANAVMRIIIDNDLMLPLDLIIEKAVRTYPRNLFAKKQIIPTHKSDKPNKSVVITSAVEFCYDRLRSLMREQGINSKLLESVTHHIPHLAYKYSMYLHDFLSRGEGIELVSTYKRVHNILTSAEKERQATINNRFQRALFIEEVEIKITQTLKKSAPIIKAAMKDHNIEQAIMELSTLNTPINNFIDGVLINHENQEIRNNRLRILAYMRHLFMQIADFSHF